jgi:hypothetical protein
MNLGKKTIAAVLVATIGLSLFAGLALAAGPGPDPITVILNLLRGVDVNVTRIDANVQTIDGTVDSIDSTVDAINSKEDSGRMEQVIEGTVTTIFTGGVPPVSALPTFNLKCNRPWDLMAVYMTTTNMNGSDYINLNYWRLGPRVLSNYLHTIDTNVTDFPVLPSDIVAGTSLITVAPNVEFYFGFSSIGTEDRFTTHYKIVIQRPTDPTFSYTLVLGQP